MSTVLLRTASYLAVTQSGAVLNDQLTKLLTNQNFKTMARIVSIFQFTGRAGSAVGMKGKGGKILLRQYQPTVANPRTAAQMSNRAKLKLAAQVAGMLGEVGRTALLANGLRKTDRGLLIKSLLQNIKVNDTKASLAYDLNLVDNPSYKRSLSLTVTSESNSFVASFSGAQEGEVIAKCILVHDVTTGNWRHVSAMDTNTTLSIGKSANESGDALEVFAYGIVLMPKTSDGFNNIGQTAADQAGYAIDLNKVSNTNYDFSPTVSAALNVAANGSTSGGSGSSTPSTGSGAGGSGTGGNGSGNGSGSGSGSGAETPTVAAPTISGSTPFAESTSVTMSAMSGATIHYTTDGSVPTASSTQYSSPLTLNATTTVKAIAIKDGVSSSVATKTFTKSNGGDTGYE